MSTVAVETPITPRATQPGPSRLLKRIAPTVVAGVFAIFYVIISPPSLDLAAHLLRAKLFSAEGFGIWNNWWYAGHHVPGYSVLFPPIAALLTPQVAGGLAATGTTALFEQLAHRRFGEDAWLGSLWFGAGTAMNLFTGRLTFAFGLLPAMGMALALQRNRPVLASVLAVLTALASPVAALFSASSPVPAVGCYVAQRRQRAAVPGLAALICSLLPVAAAVGGVSRGRQRAVHARDPVADPGDRAGRPVRRAPRRVDPARRDRPLRARRASRRSSLATPVGSNAARLGPLLAGPLAALFWWPRRKRLLAALALPLLWLQWQAPIRDVRTSAGDPSVSAAYYQPLLSFLGRQSGPPFRVEIPFTRFHWEAYQVAPRFPLARGWERQLDIKYNHLFYGGPLTSATYDAWLHQLAVRFVAVPDASLDFSAKREAHLIDRGLPYLHLVYRTPHWRVYEVAKPTPIVRGPATLKALGPNSVTLDATAPGTALVRVRFSPYWALGRGSGCVAPDGEFTAVSLRRPGPVELVIDFSLGRIGADSPRCT